MPGVVLHEFSVWFMAGILNVRAERAIQWPEAQEIAELRLNFIKLSKNANLLKVAIISLTPLLVGLSVVWFIANYVLNVRGFLDIMSSGRLEDVSAATNLMTATPDFWLWVYLLFAISNTMMPNFENLRGGRIVLIGLGVIFVALLIIGVSNEVLLSLSDTLNDGANILAGTFAVIIGFNLLVVGVLGTIESIIERITGDSATFRNGKLIAMRRAEILALREQELKKTQAISKKTAPAATPSGPPSIYRLPLPIPGAPGTEPITRRETLIVAPDVRSAFASADDRAGPALITGVARPMDEAKDEEKETLEPAQNDDDKLIRERRDTENEESDETDEEMDNDENGSEDDLTYEDAEESI